eukprot:196266_1
MAARSLSKIIQKSDTAVRMVDRLEQQLSWEQSQKSYLDSIDAFIDLSQAIFCRRKDVNKEIEYFQERRAENMRDTHYTVQAKQVESLLEIVGNTLRNDHELVINKLKDLNSEIESQMDKMDHAKEETNKMIDKYANEYKELRQHLITDYDNKCMQMEENMDQQIEKMKEKYKMMNECISELTVRQLKKPNSFQSLDEILDSDDKDNDPNDTQSEDKLIKAIVSSPSRKSNEDTVFID